MRAMPAIHENLKALRQSLGLTQEEVAGRLGVTRQTVSSYESGRTRPDLDTLKRLAEVYDTDIQAILYGSSPEQKRRRRVKGAAALSLAAAAVCGLVYAIPIWISNTWFWLEEGPLDGAGLALLERREALYGVRYAGEVLDLLLGRLFCLLLLIFAARLERPLPWRTKLKWLGLYALCALGSVMPWGLLDTHVALTNYTVTAMNCVCAAALAVGLSCIIDVIRKKRREKQESESGG